MSPARIGLSQSSPPRSSRPSGNSSAQLLLLRFPSFRAAGPKPALLVLDQFEELFYHRDTEELAVLVRELAG